MIAKNYSRWLLSVAFLVMNASTIVEGREPFMKFAVIAPCNSSADRPVMLHLKGMIDGSEVIEITHEQAIWRHRHWGWPPAPVVLADVSWNPRQRPVLPNSGNTRFLHQLVDFSSAKMKVLRGRDLVALEILPAGLTEGSYSNVRNSVLARPPKELWTDISWRPNLAEAIREAREKDKPILLWMMNGHPCGMT